MALAEYLQIPVTPTYMGKGAIPEDHPLYAGIVGIQTSQRYANALFLESDLILAVGARFADRHTGDLDVYRGERTFVQADIEPYQGRGDGGDGAMGRRVTEPGDIADTLRWAVDASEEHRLPVLVEIMTERDTDAAMGVAIDAINEYEPILDGTFERSGAVVGALPEGD
jgi:glyoxylate carboligase